MGVVEEEVIVVVVAGEGAGHERSLELGPVALEVATNTGGVDIEGASALQLTLVVTAGVGIEGARHASRHDEIGVVGAVGIDGDGVTERTALELDRVGQTSHARTALAGLHRATLDNQSLHVEGGRRAQRTGASLGQHVGGATDGARLRQRGTTADTNLSPTLAYDDGLVADGRGRDREGRVVLDGDGLADIAQCTVVRA